MNPHFFITESFLLSDSSNQTFKFCISLQQLEHTFLSLNQGTCMLYFAKPYSQKDHPKSFAKRVFCMFIKDYKKMISKHYLEKGI